MRVFFDVRSASWRRSIDDVQPFLTRARASAYALEFCLEGQAVVIPYRTFRCERPERMQHDEPEATDYP